MCVRVQLKEISRSFGVLSARISALIHPIIFALSLSQFNTIKSPEMALPSGGQTLNDRFNAARYALAGQGLARTVCKATTEELMAPKKKHLDYLLQCTYEANVSIPQMANFLIERTTHNSWVVVFKALITVHHLMCYGNERFTQYLASSNCSFQLSNFLDRTGVKGYDMSTYIRRYAKYLNEKALSYRLVALDFAKMKRGKGNFGSLNQSLVHLNSRIDC